MCSGTAITSVSRRGKFLLLQLAEEHLIAVNPMLAGRFQLVPKSERLRLRTCWRLSFEDGRDLRYYDDMSMGMTYVVRPDELQRIPRWEHMGPEALEVDLDQFRQRLRRHPGQIKNVLTNEAFVAGIGNAYADEILFAAGIYPYRTRPTLKPDEVDRLYRAMRAVLIEAIEVVRGLMGDRIDLKPREWLQVHGKGGEPCPKCGNRISQITARQRLTNFCRHCQPP
jgi:formamidopyrimidine-DNA glycosylase